MALAPASPPATAAVQSRTIYERLARGRIVVAGTCLSEGRRALIQVEEVLKGELPSQRLSIAYRMQNWERSDGQAKIEFHVGERSIMMLEPDRTEDGRPREEGLYVLAGGPEGKIEIPAEGSEVVLGAARRIVRIQSIPDQNEVWEQQRHLIEEQNPLLVEAGFQEILKFRLGNETMIPLLSGYLTHPRDSFRLGSLQVLGQILETYRRRGEKLTESGSLIPDVLSVARGDSTPEVRAQAVRTLKASGREDLREVMEQMAGKDPSQLVRYEAQLALLELHESADR